VAPYRITAADRRPLPGAYRREHRHLGYRGDELDRPFAKYFRPDLLPVQSHVRDALASGQTPGEDGYEVDEAPRRLSAPGYERLETGWTRTPKGTTVVACMTDMPGVTAEMWDWWFGWHSTETARYKLWHPGAHQFAAIGEDRSANRSLTDRQRYVDNVSYVDEYIGDNLVRLAIRFVDPATLGFADRPGTTHVCARVSASDVPVAAGWLVHQVRPTEHGSEMRSRFFLGHPEILDLPAQSTSKPRATRVLTSRPGRRFLRPIVTTVGARATGRRTGRHLLVHCASEMNHLASFLPALHAEFRDTP
jgi:hypothetical protein